MRTLTFVAVATEWFSQHGGLSTLNRSLCRALAAEGHRVYCLVPRSSDAERRDAQRGKVELVAPPDDVGDVGLSYPMILPRDVRPDVIVGHGRHTGPVAFVQRIHHAQAVLVHFVHVEPEAIE